MKILYAIQGTGNGHLARATEIIPHLRQMSDVDVLVSGVQSDLKLPFDVQYQYNGFSFFMGSKGGINYSKTLLQFKPLKLIADIAKLPVHDYDLVFTDFEPVSAWACLLKGKKSIGISHQNAVLHPTVPRPDKKDWLGRVILKTYAPATFKYGFHFSAMENHCFEPIIRSGIRNAKPENKGHYTVYLPAYSDTVIEQILSIFPHVKWEVFSKNCTNEHVKGNIKFHRVSLNGFTKSFVNCEGILTTAGFETPSEAIFMGKKLCVVPMKNQYEQLCNSAFLDHMGICVINHLQKETCKLAQWIESKHVVQIPYPDQTGNLLLMILRKHEQEQLQPVYNWTFFRQPIPLVQFKLVSLRENRLLAFNFTDRSISRWKHFWRQLKADWQDEMMR